MAAKPAEQAARGGVCSDASDAFKVHGRKRAAWIESVPAEPQNQTAEQAMVRSCGIMGPPPSRLKRRPQARAEYDGAGQCDESANGVDHG